MLCHKFPHQTIIFAAMKNVIICVLLIGLVSCGLDTRNHYFNLEDFTEGKVYCFTAEEDSSYRVYLEMHSDLNKNQLTTLTYQNSGELRSKFVEVYTDAGTELVEFMLFNDNTSYEYEVVDNEVIRWSVTDEPFSYTVISPDGTEMKNTRNYFARAHMDIMGKKYEVLGFKDVYTFNASALSITFTQKNYYAEGLGLVGMEIEEGDQVYHLKLEEILSIEAWEKRF